MKPLLNQITSWFETKFIKRWTQPETIQNFSKLYFHNLFLCGETTECPYKFEYNTQLSRYMKWYLKRTIWHNSITRHTQHTYIYIQSIDSPFRVCARATFHADYTSYSIARSILLYCHFIATTTVGINTNAGIVICEETRPAFTSNLPTPASLSLCSLCVPIQFQFE